MIINRLECFFFSEIDRVLCPFEKKTVCVVTTWIGLEFPITHSSTADYMAFNDATLACLNYCTNKIQN